MSNRPLFALPFLASACLLAIAPAHARAAGITWGAPINISGDSDVSTTGTLVAAYNFGGVASTTGPTTLVPSTTVNGVTFASFGYSGTSTTVGNVTLGISSYLANNSIFGSSLTPFSSLTTSYQTLLESGVGAFGGDITLTMGGLTPGQTYAFQWWSNDAGSSNTSGRPPYTTTATNINSVGVNDNTSGSLGGRGQYAIGTFIADSSPEVITFSGNTLLPVVNGFQLRQTSSIVPLPPAAWAGLSTLAGLAALRLFRRRRAQ